ncbi:hypothetical protein [Corynebacterium sp. A21]|uniref:hypothetical protein n=1 Tax=Corynebacterium sp. A21 TaxID=3457318 RepID=UPI003FD30EAC
MDTPEQLKTAGLGPGTVVDISMGRDVVLVPDAREHVNDVPLHRHRTHRLITGTLRTILAEAQGLAASKPPAGTGSIDPTAVAKISTATSLLPETLYYLLGRSPGNQGRKVMSKSNRDLFGFSTAQALVAQTQLNELGTKAAQLRGAAVSVDDPSSYLHGALNAEAIIVTWRDFFGSSLIILTAEAYAQLGPHANYGRHWVLEVLSEKQPTMGQGRGEWMHRADYLSVLLRLIQLRCWTLKHETPARVEASDHADKVELATALASAEPLPNHGAVGALLE